jgi:hypothetical protein
MARTKLEISKVDFQNVVNELESKQEFSNPSLLWKAVEQSEWAQKLQPRPLTASVAYMRAKELGINYKAKPGKRGSALIGGAPRGPRVPGKKKMKLFAESFALMRKTTPERFLPLVDKAEKGSKKACVKLKCLECSGWQSSEVRKCVITHCPLFPIRPYQGKVEVDEVEPLGASH